MSKPSDQELIDTALAARDKAYAPYSNYYVGCALASGDRTFVGANVENASYGLVSCAERNAVNFAVIDGVRDFDAIAIATSSSPPAAPCGLCLQALVEFTSDPAAFRVILVNPENERRDFTLAELFPHGFRSDQLKPTPR